MAMLVRNEKAYHRIVGRQIELKWGTDYEPSILATPREAPGASTASRLKSYVMQRQIHALSRSETRAALIASYNPSVWYIREQQMLFWDDHPHFLQGHPRSGSLHFPAIRGTWHVAKDLGLSKTHPVIRVYSERHNRRVRVPFPYLGDFLLFLTDDYGPYAKNITVKDKLEDFRRPFNLLGAKSPAEREASAIARHTIERLSYEAAGISTEQVAGRLIPDTLFNNLRFVHGQHWRVRELSAEKISIAHVIAADGPSRGRTPIEIGIEIEKELGLRAGLGCAVVWSGIWTRSVRADLYHVLLPDRPLLPETRDVLVEYSHWFKR